MFSTCRKLCFAQCVLPCSDTRDLTNWISNKLPRRLKEPGLGGFSVWDVKVQCVLRMSERVSYRHKVIISNPIDESTIHSQSSTLSPVHHSDTSQSCMWKRVDSFCLYIPVLASLHHGSRLCLVPQAHRFRYAAVQLITRVLFLSGAAGSPSSETSAMQRLEGSLNKAEETCAESASE